MITFRKAWPDERERAMRLCPGGRTEDACFVAVNDVPVERLIGAAFWGPLAEVAYDFDWRVVPAHAGSAVEQDFLAALKAQVAGCGGAVLKSRQMIAAETPAGQALARAGFQDAATNLIFEGTHAAVSEFQARMQRTYGLADTSALAVRSPEAADAAALKTLIAAQEGLLSAEAIDHALGPQNVGPRAFTPAWSTVLVETRTGRLVGAHLVWAEEADMRVPAMALERGLPYVPGLAWYLIFARWLGLCAAHGWSGRYFCRINPATNGAMLRLTPLFGLQEKGRLHRYVANLTSAPSSVGER